MTTDTTSFPTPSVFRQFYALTKPRVILLIVFCALIGMVLAVPGVPSAPQLGLAHDNEHNTQQVENAA